MATKYYTLFQALKSGGSKGASPATCAKEMDFALSSVAPYIHALRHKFGADIQTVRDGRQVSAYVLKNIAEVEANISPNRRPKGTAKTVAKAAKPKPVKTEAVAKVKSATIVKSTKAPRKVKDDAPVAVEDLQIEEISDLELSDIRSQLGL